MRRVLSLAALFVAVILMFSGCSFSFLNPAAIPTLPDDTPSLKMPDAGEAMPPAQLPDPVTVDGGNLNELLGGITRPDSYIWSCDVMYLSNGTQRRLSVIQYVSKGRARLESYEQGKLSSLVICRDGMAYTISPQTGDYFATPIDKTPGYDTLLSIASIADLLPLDENLPAEPRFETDGDGQNVVVFEVTDDYLNLSESYRLSADTGVPLYVESRIDNEVYYTLNTTDFDPVEPDEIYFKLPDNIEG